MKEFKGIGASEGISIGKVMLFIEEEMNIPQEKISEVQVGTEIEKLLDAQKKSKLQLISIRDKVKEKMGEDKAAIFDGHIMLLEDDDLMDEVKDKIKAEKMAASRALDEGVNEYCEMISQFINVIIVLRTTPCLPDVARFFARCGEAQVRYSERSIFMRC